MQGILTGIGFLGAGVIVHAQGNFRVHGLTSAACTWLPLVSASLRCRAMRMSRVALAIAFTLLIGGRRVERWFHRIQRQGRSGAEIQRFVFRRWIRAELVPGSKSVFAAHPSG